MTTTASEALMAITLEAIAEARAAGLKVETDADRATVFAFVAETVRQERPALWEAYANELFDALVSKHTPAMRP